MWTGLLLLWTLSEVIVNVATRTRSGEGKIQDRGSQLLLWLVIVNSITACEFLGRSGRMRILPGLQALTAIGWVVFVLGLTIRWIAIVSLGKSFSANVAIHASQTIHRSGLYRFVRHPSYSGLLLIFAAIGLHSNDWMGLAAALIGPTAALLYRIHVEEIALRGAFGDEYIEYSKVTKRLVPGLF